MKNLKRLTQVTLVLVGIYTTLILFICHMYDAYKSAEKINADIARGIGTGGGPPVN